MTFLKNLAWFLPFLSFGVFGFADDNGGNGDDDKKKGQDDPNKDKGKDKDDDDDDLDPKIKEIQKDPDAVAALLRAKRDANSQAKKFRLELEDLKSKQKDADDKALKDQEKYKELAEKKEAELNEKEILFKAQLILLALKAEAGKQGIIDADLVALIPVDDIEVKDDFSLEGIQEAVEAFKEKKPDFFKEGDDEDPDKKPGDSKRPNLRDKVKGTQEGLSPLRRIAKGLEKKK